MNRETKLALLAASSALCLFASIYLLTTEFSSYAILTVTMMIIIVAYGIIYYKDSKDSYTIYKTTLRNLINTYDSLLVKSEKLPDLYDHNIIRTATMEDLVYAQMVIKKPIFFYEEEKSCSFVLIMDQEVCVYILKANPDDITATEIIIDEIKRQPKKEEEIEVVKEEPIVEEKIKEESLFDDIEHTTIIKLENNKSYKISPVKKEDTFIVKDITQILDVVNEVRENGEESNLYINIEPKKKKKKGQKKVKENKIELVEDKKVEEPPKEETSRLITLKYITETKEKNVVEETSYKVKKKPKSNKKTTTKQK